MVSKRRRPRIPRRAQRARSGKYKFSVKTHPIQGIISFGLGLASLAVLAVSCYLAAKSRGNIGVMTGLLNVFAFIMSIGGVILALTAFRKKDIHMRFPVLGIALNGILTIVYLVIYITGTLL